MATFASVFKDGPQTVTVNADSAAQAGFHPAFSGSMGYGDSSHFPLSATQTGTVSVSYSGVVTVTGPSCFSTGYVSASVSVPDTANQAQIGDVSSKMSACAPQSANSLYGYTSVYGYSSPVSLGSPALGKVGSPDPLVLGFDGR